MKAACQEFRARLASSLAGRVVPAEPGERAELGERAQFGVLAWHEHLLACADCRDLLAAEEALEQLLASLPEPKLPRALAERVLSRLEPVRASDVALDALLDLTPAASAPAELGRRVLAKLETQRKLELEHAEQRLDHLLERVPAPGVPARLTARILAALEAQRERVAPRTLRPVPAAPRATVATSATVAQRKPVAVARPQPAPRGASRRWLYALAASLAIGCAIAAWLLSPARHQALDENTVAKPSPVEAPGSHGGAPQPSPENSAAGEPPQELLASLDLLESWDMVTDDSLDARLNTLDNFDELLLSIDADSAATDSQPTDTTPSTEPPSKG